MLHQRAVVQSENPLRGRDVGPMHDSHRLRESTNLSASPLIALVLSFLLQCVLCTPRLHGSERGIKFSSRRYKLFLKFINKTLFCLLFGFEILGRGKL